MKCILLATGRTSLLLGPVLDRPYLQHVVEQLVGHGVERIHLLVQSDRKEVRSLLGDGSRWGVRIEYTLTSAEPDWSNLAAAAQGEEGGLLLAGRAERLPHLSPVSPDAAPNENWPAIYFEEEHSRARWTGWVLMKGRDLAAFATRLAAGLDWREASRQEALQARKVFLERVSLSCESETDLLRSNRTALDGEFPGLFFRGKEIRPGVWMARAAKVPETVELHAPCYIGEESWIGAGCQVGPHAVIGPRCIVAKGTTITRSIVAEATYLGPELEVADSVVAQDRIHNVRLGAEVLIEESHVACSLDGQGTRTQARQ